MASQPPVQCIRCKSTAVILGRPTDPRTRQARWRYRCLDDGTAWWVDEHGGDITEYEEKGTT